MDLLKKFSPARVLWLLSGLCIAAPALAQTSVSISLKESFLPASDLVFVEPDGTKTILSSTGAWKKEGVDLSTLEPNATNYWSPAPAPLPHEKPGDYAQRLRLHRDGLAVAGAAEDAAVPVQAEGTVEYSGVLESSSTLANISSGLFKFNAIARTPDGPKPVTLILHKNLHAILLKKELLRRLGYHIQGLKWLPRVKVHFPDLLERDKFIRSLYAQTDGDPLRWDVSSLRDDPLSMTLQDVAVMEATPVVKTLAFGPPITVDAQGVKQPLGPRTLRALALVYGVANVPESVNRAVWGQAHVTNNNFVFTVSEEGNFGVVRDDALWILRKLAALESDEFRDVVDRAFYPEAVGQILHQVLLANRDSFLEGMKIPNSRLSAKTKKLPKLTQKEWPGYASEFVFGDAESPLAHFQHYVFSTLEANAMSNLIALANAQIPSLNFEDAARKHMTKMAELAMTGQGPTPLSFHLWAAPLVDGGLDVSRNIALGAYLGTNNQLQLADTFGIHLNVGVAINTDPLPTAVQGQVLVQAQGQLSLTHIKPLKKLSQATKTPLTDVFVPMFFGRLKAIFGRVFGMEGEPGTTAEVLAKELDQLTRYLPVGDSLILTESLTGIEQLSATLGFPALSKLAPNVGVNGGATQLVLGRVQIYRKSATQIQVFKDHGTQFSWVAGAGANLWNSMPVLRLSGRNVSGEGSVRVFNVDITPDPAANSQVFYNAHALSQVLRSGSTELLQARLRSATITSVFKDRPRSFQLLQKVRRRLKTTTESSTEIPDQPDGDFISFTNGRQRGNHYQLLATQIANYYVQKILETDDYELGIQSNPNPGQSIFGSSTTRDAQFQGRLDPELAQPFVSVQYRWEGWQASAEKLQKVMAELNERYRLPVTDPTHLPFFNERELQDARAVQLYNLNLSLNLYEPALQAMLSMSDAAREAYVDKYRKIHRCFFDFSAVCAATSRFSRYWKRAHRADLTPQEYAEAIFIMASNFERFADFEDLVRAVGGVDHLYVSAALTGFRKKSEVTDPIRSNSFGTRPAEDPDGILDTIRVIFGIENGEFQMKWMRDVL